MVESFSENISKTCAYKALPDMYKVPLNECHPLYSHQTLRITSLSEYIEVVSVIKSAAKKGKTDLVFRGMADHRWELLPSIARQTLITEQTEHKMVNELMLLYPEEFANISSEFDLLAKMQHYGLPTRLLDFTTNPLVALFFACQKEKSDSMGRVITTIPVLYPFTDHYIKAVCGLCKMNSSRNQYLENLIETSLSFVDFIHCTKYPLIAKPQYSNARIKNQAAMFMVFANEIWDRGAMIVYGGLESVDTAGELKVRDEYQDILPLEDLEKIYPKIKENWVDIESWFTTHEGLLKMCGYYEQDTDIERKSRYINGIWSKESIPFKNRFVVIPKIKKIDEEVMHNSFCSILIEPKCKKKILEELDTININERFLFPELEYTVKHVKQKYWSSHKD